MQLIFKYSRLENNVGIDPVDRPKGTRRCHSVRHHPDGDERHLGTDLKATGHRGPPAVRSELHSVKRWPAPPAPVLLPATRKVLRGVRQPDVTDELDVDVQLCLTMIVADGSSAVTTTV